MSTISSNVGAGSPIASTSPEHLVDESVGSEMQSSEPKSSYGGSEAPSTPDTIIGANSSQFEEQMELLQMSNDVGLGISAMDSAQIEKMEFDPETRANIEDSEEVLIALDPSLKPLETEEGPNNDADYAFADKLIALQDSNTHGVAKSRKDKGKSMQKRVSHRTDLIIPMNELIPKGQRLTIELLPAEDDDFPFHKKTAFDPTTKVFGVHSHMPDEAPIPSYYVYLVAMHRPDVTDKVMKGPDRQWPSDEKRICLYQWGVWVEQDPQAELINNDGTPVPMGWLFTVDGVQRTPKSFVWEKSFTMRPARPKNFVGMALIGRLNECEIPAHIASVLWRVDPPKDGPHTGIVSEWMTWARTAVTVLHVVGIAKFRTSHAHMMELIEVAAVRNWYWSWKKGDPLEIFTAFEVYLETPRSSREARIRNRDY